MKKRRCDERNEQEVHGTESRTVVVIKYEIDWLLARVAPVQNAVDRVGDAEQFGQPDVEEAERDGNHEHVADDVDRVD